MSGKHVLGIVAVVAGLFTSGPQAMALNPQPLPPHLAPSLNAHLHNGGAPINSVVQQRRWDSSILRCRSVQVGDPRKQPPMKVCP